MLINMGRREMTKGDAESKGYKRYSENRLPISRKHRLPEEGTRMLPYQVTSAVTRKGSVFVTASVRYVLLDDWDEVLRVFPDWKEGLHSEVTVTLFDVMEVEEAPF